MKQFSQRAKLTSRLFSRSKIKRSDKILSTIFMIKDHQLMMKEEK
jgi:hypothetical protein